jgi:hypothetical protein
MQKKSFWKVKKSIINEIESRNNLPNLYPTIETVMISKAEAVEKSFKEVMIKDMFDDGEEEPFLEYKSIVTNQWKLLRNNSKKIPD